jgi:flagellar export protein FliJ
LRERTEDQAKQAFAGAMQDRVRSERDVKAAAERIAKAREAQLTLTSAPTSATELLARQAYLERSEQAHRVSQEDLGRRDRALEQKRQELTHAARDRQSLERLKERRRDEHQQAQARIEAASLDEIALNGFRRRAAA